MHSSSKWIAFFKQMNCILQLTELHSSTNWIAFFNQLNCIFQPTELHSSTDPRVRCPTLSVQLLLQDTVIVYIYKIVWGPIITLKFGCVILLWLIVTQQINYKCQMLYYLYRYTPMYPWSVFDKSTSILYHFVLRSFDWHAHQRNSCISY